MKIWILSIIFNVLCIVSTKGQSLEKDFAMISNNYQISDVLSIDYTIKNFQDRNGMPSSELKGMIRKTKDNYYSKSGSEEMLINERFSIWVKNEEKEIFLTRKKEKKNDVSQLMSEFKMDSLLKLSDSVKLVLRSKTLVTYAIFQSKSLLNRVDVSYDPRTNYLEKLTFYYPSSTNKEVFPFYKTEISYVTNKTLENPEVFNETNYITLMDNKIRLSNRIIDYSLNIQEE